MRELFNTLSNVYNFFNEKRFIYQQETQPPPIPKPENIKTPLDARRAGRPVDALDFDNEKGLEVKGKNAKEKARDAQRRIQSEADRLVNQALRQDRQEMARDERDRARRGEPKDELDTVVDQSLQKYKEAKQKEALAKMSPKDRAILENAIAAIRQKPDEKESVLAKFSKKDRALLRSLGMEEKMDAALQKEPNQRMVDNMKNSLQTVMARGSEAEKERANMVKDMTDYADQVYQKGGLDALAKFTREASNYARNWSAKNPYAQKYDIGDLNDKLEAIAKKYI